MEKLWSDVGEAVLSDVNVLWTCCVGFRLVVDSFTTFCAAYKYNASTRNRSISGILASVVAQSITSSAHTLLAVLI